MTLAAPYRPCGEVHKHWFDWVSDWEVQHGEANHDSPDTGSKPSPFAMSELAGDIGPSVFLQ